MKLTRNLLALALAFSLSLLSFIALPIHTVTAQEVQVALQRGYRTGYSDGYMAGYRDIIDGDTKNYARHSEYGTANRAFNKDYGTLEDYKDGYQQGFESGYDAGFEKRSFESTVPSNLQKRGGVAVNTVPETTAEPVSEPAAPTAENTAETPATSQETSNTDVLEKVSFKPVSDAIIIIPKDTELIVELFEDISTERNRTGDKFTARVISPSEISGAVIEGRVEKIQKPGRIKRRSELALSFDRIILSENRWSNYDAILEEVLPVKGDNVKRVDDEGAAVGQSSLKGDIIKVGGATGAGAGIGAIAGGPVGAGIGAGVGAAFGVGAVIIERGKHVNLNKSQQLRIRTSYETQIR